MADPTARPEADRSEILYRFLHVVFKRKWTVLGIFVATFVLVCFATFLITPTWTGTASIMVEAAPKAQWNLFEDLMSPAPPTNPEIAAQNIAVLLQSEALAEDVVRKFRLDERLRRKQEEPGNPRDKIKKAIMDVVLSPVTLLQELGILGTDKSWVDKSVTDFLKDWVDVEVAERTQVIQLAIDAETVELAQSIPNAMVELVRARLQDFARQEIAARHALVARESAAVEAQLAEAREELRQFKTENSLLDLSEAVKAQVQAVEDLRMQEAMARSDLAVQAKRSENLAAQLAAAPAKLLTSTTEELNPTVVTLKAQIASLEVDRAGLLAFKTEQDSQVFALDEKLAQARRSLGAETERIVRAQTFGMDTTYQDLLTRKAVLDNDQFAAGARLDGLAQVLRGLEERIAKTSANEMRYVHLQSKASLLDTIRANLSRKQIEMQSLLESGITDVTLRVAPAVSFPFSSSDWPMWEINLPVAILLGLVLGVAWPLWSEYWADTFVTSVEAERVLGMSALGCLP